MRFRFHRGGMSESLETVVEVGSIDALADLLSAEIEHPVSPKAIRIEPYAGDLRTGWDTHIVSIAGLGVMGFTDGVLDSEPLRVRLRADRMSGHGLDEVHVYEVDNPDYETVSAMDHLTLVGQPGAYPWRDFEVVKS